MTSENLSLKYGLISSEVLAKYPLSGTLELAIELDEFALLHDQTLAIKSGDTLVRELAITAPTLSVLDLPVGDYTLTLPILAGYTEPSALSFVIQANATTKLAYTYQKIDAEAEQAYQALKAQAISIITAYQAKVTEDELNNKRLNPEEKATVLAQYELLRAADQAPYTELINRIRRGGVPVLSYVGEQFYQRSSDIDFYHVIRAVDNEDGELELNASNTHYTLTKADSASTAGLQTFAANEVGSPYRLAYTVTDSDQNSAELSVTITIGETSTPPTGDQDQDNSGSNGSNDNAGSGDYNQGGNNNGDNYRPSQPNPDQGNSDNGGSNNGSTSGNTNSGSNSGNNSANRPSNNSGSNSATNNNTNNNQGSQQGNQTPSSSNSASGSSNLPNALPKTGPATAWQNPNLYLPLIYLGASSLIIIACVSLYCHKSRH